MGLDKWAAALVNPTAVIGTGLAIGSDIYAAHEQRKATEDANRTSAEIAERERALQREFAQMGIRWKVEDAVAAGLHPLAAIGAVGASYSPSGQTIFPDNSKADMYRSMGQNISRAVMSTATSHERKMMALQLERGMLENELLRSQISTINRTTNPPFPSDDTGIAIPGQGDSSNTIEQVPVRRTASIPGAPYADFGHVADFGFVRTPRGLAIVPSKDVKERVEDQLIPETMWALRNGLLPNVPGNHYPTPTTKEFPLPREAREQGYKSWQWSYTLQQYVPSRAPEGAGFFRRQKARFLWR